MRIPIIHNFQRMVHIISIKFKICIDNLRGFRIIWQKTGPTDVTTALVDDDAVLEAHMLR